MPPAEMFKKVEDEYLRLKGELGTDKITREKFESSLKDLAFQYEGRYWNIGPSTGKWHVYNGEKWVPAEPPAPASGEKTTEGDLFPVYGVTLGKTTVQQLAQLGRIVTDETEAACHAYEIRGTKFWYNDSGVADHMAINRMTRLFSDIPEPWHDLGFDWHLSCNQWIALLQRIGYSVRVEKPPQIVRDKGFLAVISGTKAGKPQIQLDFNYNHGSDANSEETLCGISVMCPEYAQQFGAALAKIGYLTPTQ